MSEMTEAADVAKRFRRIHVSLRHAVDSERMLAERLAPVSGMRNDLAKGWLVQGMDYLVGQLRQIDINDPKALQTLTEQVFKQCDPTSYVATQRAIAVMLQVMGSSPPEPAPTQAPPATASDVAPSAPPEDATPRQQRWSGLKGLSGLSS